MTVQATVVIPTYDHGPLIRYSVDSVLAQTVRDIEVFIIGDGVPDGTREIAAELTRRDSRVRFFDNPKSPRTGEPWRKAALDAANGTIVCYLDDDDLYMPDHVEYMLELLRRADFVSAMAHYVDGQGVLCYAPTDFSDPAIRRMELRGKSMINLTSAAHTMAMYRRLPHGWRTTPPGIRTDLHMWQQFLSDPDCRAISATRPTTLCFPSTLRPGWSLEQRMAELEAWRPRVADPLWRDRLVIKLLDRAVNELPEVEARLHQASSWWWTRSRLQRVPALRSLWRALRRAGSALTDR